MPATGPDLNLLVALRALLEEANVTRAGARLKIGQSSMSAMLARLRRQYHDELLIQVGRSFELTPLARQLLPQVQLALPLVERALGREEAFDPATSTRVFSFVLTDYALAELKSSLYAVAQAAPRIGIDLRHIPDAPLDPDRDLRSIDFLVAEPGAGDDTEGVDLLRDRFVLLVDRAHPALVDGAIGAADFLAFPHVRTEPGRGRRSPYQQRLIELELRPHYRVTAASSLALPSIVAGTELIAAVPSRMLRATGPDARVVAVDFPFAPVEIHERLTWHSSRTSDGGHTWFREALRMHRRQQDDPEDPQSLRTISPT